MDNDRRQGHTPDTRVVSASEFKVRCLRLMDEVAERGGEIVITKRGKPVARLVPVRDEERPIFGAMKGTAKIVGDITAPLDAAWEATAGDDSG